MNEKPRAGAIMAEIQIPFKYVIVHGTDPSKKSNQQKAVTKSINLMGLVFETDKMEIEGFHLSFTEVTYGRNSLVIFLDLGKRFGPIEIVGQVDWYEKRVTHLGSSFIVGIGFIDVQADATNVLREFLIQNRGFQSR
jgi:hypothetical protein